MNTVYRLCKTKLWGYFLLSLVSFDHDWISKFLLYHHRLCTQLKHEINRLCNL